MSETRKPYPPYPERIRPAKSRKGRDKPYALEIKSRNPDSAWCFFPDWTSIRRYVTEADVRKAFASYSRKLWSVRIVGPDGVLDTFTHPESRP